MMTIRAGVKVHIALGVTDILVGMAMSHSSASGAARKFRRRARIGRHGSVFAQIGERFVFVRAEPFDRQRTGSEPANRTVEVHNRGLARRADEKPCPQKIGK